RQGADSPLNENFAPDTYRERLFAARDVLSEAASDAGGDYVDTIQSDLEGTYSMSTADGGALVFVPITVASSFSVDDATVSVPAADQPLVDGDLDDRVTHHYSDFVVIYVPGPGVDSRPSVVAAE